MVDLIDVDPIYYTSNRECAKSPEFKLWCAFLDLIVQDLKSECSPLRTKRTLSLIKSEWIETVCDWVGIDHSAFAERCYKYGTRRFKNYSIE